ncbi:hypothetical protein QR680_009191 [Steinernema hermaphroditum]|uniref:Tyrosine-protein phosphatase domain-containing protein n=1 Tax=Steinernema hermaphroditum TaxID=289476 RepID=A0AA39IJD2_9BILA|nr:hypothetical protein QR680_009191 [Steinernema hermaphroditum]
MISSESRPKRKRRSRKTHDFDHPLTPPHPSKKRKGHKKERKKKKKESKGWFSKLFGRKKASKHKENRTNMPAPPLVPSKTVTCSELADDIRKPRRKKKTRTSRHRPRSSDLSFDKAAPMETKLLQKPPTPLATHSPSVQKLPSPSVIHSKLRSPPTLPPTPPPTPPPTVPQKLSSPAKTPPKNAQTIPSPSTVPPRMPQREKPMERKSNESAEKEMSAPVASKPRATLPVESPVKRKRRLIAVEEPSVKPAVTVTPFLRTPSSPTTAESQEETLEKAVGAIAENIYPEYDCGSESVHVAKIRFFVRAAVSGEIEKSTQIFRKARTQIPLRATRSAFNANLSKCRFRDVVCLDSTRVVLEGKKFIHASRVPYGNSRNECMIVTQMPLKHTVADFWSMVWQEKANAVLLIATATEWAEVGAHLDLYPSKTDTMDLADGMSVTWLSMTEVRPSWRLVALRLRRGTERRLCDIVHFEGWRHGKAPDAVETVWEIQSYLRKKARPLVIVSMSGVGRAGSYAVLEHAHSAIHDPERKNFRMLECVEHVRSHRFHSLQSPLQVSFVYFALLNHLFSIKNVVSDVPERLFEKYLALCGEFHGANEE